MPAKPIGYIGHAYEARFMEYVERNGPDACWPYLRAIQNGYGVFYIGGRCVKAHRVAWFLWSGQPEPGPGLQLDHTCHNPDECKGECEHRRCCNPAHMRVATPAENVANSNARSRQRREQEKCDNGHPYTEKNTRWYEDKAGYRYRICRRCQADITAARKPLKGKRLDLDTHCPNGHRWDEAGYFTDKHGSKICRECARQRNRAYKDRKRAEKAAAVARKDQATAA